MDPRLEELIERLEAPGRAGALSASEFAELCCEVRKQSELLETYRFIAVRKILHDKEVMEALKTWRPRMFDLITADMHYRGEGE